MKTFVLMVLLAMICSSEARLGHKRRCKRRCGQNIDIVCGTDGKTYWNECALRNARCHDRHLRKAINGPCENIFGKSIRGLTYDPVCGTNKRTYSNAAYLDLASCLKRSYTRVLSKGKCRCRHAPHKRGCTGIKCDTGCPKIINPVCGDDGNTYSSQCVLDKVNCILGGKALKKAHNGVCRAVLENAVGSPKFRPVCGSDGNTYTVKQYIDVARCQDSHLRRVSHRKCH